LLHIFIDDTPFIISILLFDYFHCHFTLIIIDDIID